MRKTQRTVPVSAPWRASCVLQLLVIVRVMAMTLFLFRRMIAGRQAAFDIPRSHSSICGPQSGPPRPAQACRISSRSASAKRRSRITSPGSR